MARNIGSGYAGAAVSGLVLLLLTPLVIRHFGTGDCGIRVLASAIGSHMFLGILAGPAESRNEAAPAALTGGRP